MQTFPKHIYQITCNKIFSYTLLLIRSFYILDNQDKALKKISEEKASEMEKHWLIQWSQSTARKKFEKASKSGRRFHQTLGGVGGRAGIQDLVRFQSLLLESRAFLWSILLFWVAGVSPTALCWAAVNAALRFPKKRELCYATSKCMCAHAWGILYRWL